MNITTDHWLEGAKRELVTGGREMNLRRVLVMHCTCGATAQSSIDGWRAKGDGICTHVVIDRDGTIIQCRPFNKSCGHVRDICSWNGFRRLNSCSIGIEMANAGSDLKALSWARKLPGFASIKARHKNGGPVREWECYTDAQKISLRRVIDSIVPRYNLDAILAHEDLDSSRRDDPGPAFPPEFFKLVKHT